VADPVALQPNKPVETTDPALQVQGMTKPGAYTFQLVVTDDVGLASAPDTLVVTVTPPAGPNPR
jgi:hypothetical protein